MGTSLGKMQGEGVPKSEANEEAQAEATGESQHEEKAAVVDDNPSGDESWSNLPVDELSPPLSSSSEDSEQKNTVTEPEVVKRTIPVVSLRAGLSDKASAADVRSWIALSLTLDGRDKITKVLQYSARLLAWYYGSQRFANLKVSLTNSRKAYRIGRTLIELQKLRSMGLLESLGWHLHRIAEGKDSTPAPPSGRPTLLRRVSTNIGWGPSTEGTRRSIVRSISSVGYRVYRPMASFISLSGEHTREPTSSTWDLIASAGKMLGLAGFWTGDNVSFLSQSGLFDDFQLSSERRLTERKALVTRASHFANRCYFGGAVAGFLLNWKLYWFHRQKALGELMKEAEESDDPKAFQDEIQRARTRQFVLFLALLKSTCDVLVFSNNAGIDLWKKYAGFKMHEGLHCLLGLTSASTVLYNNYPKTL